MNVELTTRARPASDPDLPKTGVLQVVLADAGGGCGGCSSDNHSDKALNSYRPYDTTLLTPLAMMMTQTPIFQTGIIIIVLY